MRPATAMLWLAVLSGTETIQAHVGTECVRHVDQWVIHLRQQQGAMRNTRKTAREIAMAGTKAIQSGNPTEGIFALTYMARVQYPRLLKDVGDVMDTANNAHESALRMMECAKETP